MEFTCTIELDFDSPSEAEHAASALGPDNEGFVEVEIKGSMLVAKCRADSPDSLRHTVDDLLACLAVAVGAGEIGHEEE
jgi:hypothetical protein